jgi:hypothetical protein
LVARTGPTRDSIELCLSNPAWNEYYTDEMDAAWLYRALARVERNVQRRSHLRESRQVEDEHVERWRSLFHEHGGEVPRHSPSIRSRMLATVARLLGSGAVLPLIIAEESREVGVVPAARPQGHRTKRRTIPQVAIATESAEHAQHLSSSIGREGEPWHGIAAGGYLRSVVYGFNDGLTANFGLCRRASSARASNRTSSSSPASQGALADALSMGSSGYLAAKSEAEVAARQVAIERDELRLMPDLEEKELALILEAKGLTPGECARVGGSDDARSQTGARNESAGGARDSATVGHSARRRPGDGDRPRRFGAVIPLIPFLTLPLGDGDLGVVEHQHARPFRGRRRPAASSPAGASGRADATCFSSASALRCRLFHRVAGDQIVTAAARADRGAGRPGGLGRLRADLELMLANAIAGRPLQSMDEYAVVLNALTGSRCSGSWSRHLSRCSAGYLCAKLAEGDEMRYTLSRRHLPHPCNCRWQRRGIHASGHPCGRLRCC